MPDRDARFEISANDRTAAGTESAARHFEDVDKAAKKAQRSIDEMGDESSQLARKLLAAKVAAHGLAREFDRTGDAKILKDFQKINREAAGLAKVGKSLQFDLGVKNPEGFIGSITKLARRAGLVASDAAIDGFSDLFKALPPEIQGGIIVGAAAGALFLQGAIEGAILAGVAAGAIGLTALIAAQNETVAQQYSVLGDRIMLKLKDASKPMVKELLANVPVFSAAFDRELPGIQRIMKRAAQDLRPVIGSIIEAVHVLMPSLERAAAVGGMVLGRMMGQLPALTGAIGELFDAFSSGGQGAADSMVLLMGTLTTTVRILALMAATSAPALNMFGKLLSFLGILPDLTKHLNTAYGAQKEAAGAAAMAATDYETLAQSLGNTANMARQLQDNFNSLFGTEMGVQQANLAVNMGMQNLNETLRNNKKTLDQSTEAGAQNAQGILEQIDRLNRKREADIAAGNGTAEATAQANAAYQSQVGALRALLIQLGFSASAVDQLIGRLYAIPSEITTTVTTIFRTVYRTDGTPATGHSRYQSGYDLSALDGWAPAQFNAAQRGAFQAAAASGVDTTQPPVQVHSEANVTVELDGQPFRTQIRRTTRAAEKRQAWRAHVGTR